MNITKRHTVFHFPPFKGGLRRVLLSLLTILVGLFVVSACQDDLPDTTEVMMTFTTRAVVTQGNESDAINIEKMNDLRVIVVRENGDIVYNDTRQVGGASTATVSFQTPVKTGGENFKFFAIANYSSLVNAPDWANVNIDNLITHVEGNGSEISINSPIPQTKYWEYPVKQLLGETQSITKQLDFLASKISVQFINTYDAAQTLGDIYITGITPNGKGRLFNRPTGVKDNEGEEIYEEVYVDSNVTLTDGKIDFGSIDVGAATNEGSTPTSSVIHHYYSYPVDKDNISSPTLHATWNNKTYELPLEGITELKRNDHLKIVVTLTGHALTVNYTIADWVKEPTNIGSPTTNGGYHVDGWGNGNDIIIGGEIGGGDTPGGGEDPNPDPEPEPDVPVVPGDVIWYKTCNIAPDYGSAPIQLSFSSSDMTNFVEGRIFGVVYDISEQNNGRELYIRVYDTSGGHNNNTLPSAKGNNGNVFSDEGQYYFELTSEDIAAIALNDGSGGISFWGNGITITQIYIKAPASQ